MLGKTALHKLLVENIELGKGGHLHTPFPATHTYVKIGAFFNIKHPQVLAQLVMPASTEVECVTARVYSRTKYFNFTVFGSFLLPTHSFSTANIQNRVV